MTKDELVHTIAVVVAGMDAYERDPTAEEDAAFNTLQRMVDERDNGDRPQLSVAAVEARLHAILDAVA